MKTKILSLALALILLLSCSMNVFAATTEEIEPRYAVTPCLVCGASARIVEQYTRKYVGYAIVPARGCELDRSLGSHQHDCYRDCILVNCPNCGEFEMLRSDYEYCTVKYQYIY